MILDARGHETNGNGADLTERQRLRMMAQNATLGEVNDIAHAHAVQAVNHLGNQIPGLVHSIITAAIQGYHASLIELGVIPATTPIGKYIDGASPSDSESPDSRESIGSSGESPDSNAPANFCDATDPESLDNSAQ